MLKEKALYYLSHGYNCSQSIIFACGEYYDLDFGEYVGKLFVTASNGFGIGGMCNAVVACIMFFGVYYRDEKTARQAALLFLSRFKENMGDINCSKLYKNGCENVISCACDTLEDVLKYLGIEKMIDV